MILFAGYLSYNNWEILIGVASPDCFNFDADTRSCLWFWFFVFCLGKTELFDLSLSSSFFGFC